MIDGSYFGYCARLSRIFVILSMKKSANCSADALSLDAGGNGLDCLVPVNSDTRRYNCFEFPFESTILSLITDRFSSFIARTYLFLAFLICS